MTITYRGAVINIMRNRDCRKPEGHEDESYMRPTPFQYGRNRQKENDEMNEYMEKLRQKKLNPHKHMTVVLSSKAPKNPVPRIPKTLDLTENAYKILKKSGHWHNGKPRKRKNKHS